MNVKLYELLSTGERVKIVESVIFESEVRVGEVSKKINLSKGLVSKYLDILVKEGVMKRKDGVFVVLEGYKTKALKIMLTVLNIPDIFKKYPFVKAVGLYGSSAKGANTKASDVDLWIKVNSIKNEGLPKLNSELAKGLREVNVLFLDDAKVSELKKQDMMFYHSLFFGSIIVYGNENEI